MASRHSSAREVDEQVTILMSTLCYRGSSVSIVTAGRSWIMSTGDLRGVNEL
jgi:hypothetical protein